MLKKINLLLGCFFIASLIVGQPHRPRNNHNKINNSFVKLQFHSFVGDTTNLVLALYKIPYNRLVFIKNRDEYTAGLKFSLEIFEDENFIVRHSDKKFTSVKSYEETKSEEKFLEGYLSFPIKSGNYIVKPNVSLVNTDFEINLQPHKLNTENKINLVWGNWDNNLNEIIVENTNNSAPYFNKAADLFIILDENLGESIKIKLDNLNNEQLNVTGDRILNGNIGLQIDENVRIVQKNNGRELNIYRFPRLNLKMHQGDYTLFIAKSDYKPKRINCVWLDAPRSLRNPEFAINILNVFENEDVIEKLLDYPEEKYYDELVKHWKKYDKDTSTTFNEVMSEFYHRADFAMLNYGSVNKRNGALSDRGKVYMIFGKPDKIERSYNEDNFSIEIWRYFKIKKEFVFTDASGLGNYKLSE